VCVCVCECVGGCVCLYFKFCVRVCTRETFVSDLANLDITEGHTVGHTIQLLHCYRTVVTHCSVLTVNTI
jgi:hypothetical protein